MRLNQMLRRDTSAAFESTGAWIFRRYRFVSGRLQSPRSLSQASYQRLQKQQQKTPALVMAEAARRKRWWYFRDEFYWEDEALSETEVKALLLERLNQQQRRVQRAVALMEQTAPPSASQREVIAEALRVEVWRRDGGRCVQCGSKRRLQYDHLIPVRLGGASSIDNLQLLCADCNRAKGASLT